MNRLIKAAQDYIGDLEDHEGAEGFSISTEEFRKKWDKAVKDHRSFGELWTDDVEQLRGDMFFWARPKGDGGWSVGVGYWCKDGGWAGSEYGRTGQERYATRFHPFPDPPRT